jgi:hypothetical protein
MCVLLFAVVCCYACIMCSKCTVVNCFLKIFLKNPTFAALDKTSYCGAHATRTHTITPQFFYMQTKPHSWGSWTFAATVGQIQHTAHSSNVAYVATAAPEAWGEVFSCKCGAATVHNSPTSAALDKTSYCGANATAHTAHSYCPHNCTLLHATGTMCYN